MPREKPTTPVAGPGHNSSIDDEMSYARLLVYFPAQN